MVSPRRLVSRSSPTLRNTSPVIAERTRTSYSPQQFSDSQYARDTNVYFHELSKDYKPQLSTKKTAFYSTLNRIAIDSRPRRISILAGRKANTICLICSILRRHHLHWKRSQREKKISTLPCSFYYEGFIDDDHVIHHPTQEEIQEAKDPS